MLCAAAHAAAASAAAMADDDDDDDDDIPGLEALSVLPPPRVIMGPSGRLYHSESLGCLRVAQEPRRACIRLVESRFFDPIILTAILTNCAILAWQSPLDPPNTKKAAFIDAIEEVYLIIFTFELLVKVVAYGVVGHTSSYLRDPWCQLDFIIVTLSWVPILIPSFGNYSVVRSVRALRPLRALKRMPGMVILINSMLSALPKLANVSALCGLLVVVLGIMGTEEFQGALHYRCALDGFAEEAGHPDLFESLGALPRHVLAREALAREALPREVLAQGALPHEALARLGDGARALLDGAAFEGAPAVAPAAERRSLRSAGQLRPSNAYDTGEYCDPRRPLESCAVGSACAYFDENMNHGVATFDTFGWTAIVILQAMTFDGWSLGMYGLRAVLASPLALCFYAIIILFGGFYLVNLFLAVLFQEFVDAQVRRTSTPHARPPHKHPARASAQAPRTRVRTSTPHARPPRHPASLRVRVHARIAARVASPALASQPPTPTSDPCPQPLSPSLPPSPTRRCRPQAVEKAIGDEKLQAAFVRRQLERGAQRFQAAARRRAFHSWAELSAVGRLAANFSRRMPLSQAFALWRGERTPVAIHRAEILQRVVRVWQGEKLSMTFYAWHSLWRTARAARAAAAAEAEAARARARAQAAGPLVVRWLVGCVRRCAPWAFPTDAASGDDASHGGAPLLPRSTARSDAALAGDGGAEHGQSSSRQNGGGGEGRGSSARDDDDDADDADEESGRPSARGAARRALCDCAPPAGSWREALAHGLASPWVDRGFTSLVLLNLIVMCLPYHGMSAVYSARLELATAIITWCFITEMALKLIGHGCAAYWADGWNTLDGAIVVTSICEMVLSTLATDTGVSISYLRILRMLRVARVLRLMRSWKGLYRVVLTVSEALPQMSNVFIRARPPDRRPVGPPDPQSATPSPPDPLSPAASPSPPPPPQSSFW